MTRPRSQEQHLNTTLVFYAPKNGKPRSIENVQRRWISAVFDVGAVDRSFKTLRLGASGRLGAPHPAAHIDLTDRPAHMSQCGRLPRVFLGDRTTVRFDIPALRTAEGPGIAIGRRVFVADDPAAHCLIQRCEVAVFDETRFLLYPEIAAH